MFFKLRQLSWKLILNDLDINDSVGDKRFERHHMCLHIFSHGQYGNCLIIFQPFRTLDTQSLRVSANLKPHLSGHANVKHHIVTTKRATCVGIPTAEINWCVVTIFPPLKVPVITFPQVWIPTNVPAYKTINKPELKSFNISLLHSQPKDKTAFFCYSKRCREKTKSGWSRWHTGVKFQVTGYMFV